MAVVNAQLNTMVNLFHKQTRKNTGGCLSCIHTAN